MKRSSQDVGDLVLGLAARGIAVRPRRIEGWSVQGLGPLAGIAPAQRVEHFAVLSRLSASGRSADVAAIRMAARGFACPRVSEAIRRELGIDDAEAVSDLPNVDVSTAPSGDPGFAELEEAAFELERDLEQMPGPFARLFGSLQANAARQARGLDETGEAVFHSGLVNLLCALVGDGMYDPRFFVAIMGDDPKSVEPRLMEDLNGLCESFSLKGMLDAYFSVPPELIAWTAPRLRPMVMAMVGDGDSGSTHDDELDWLSVTYSPVAVYSARIIWTYERANAARAVASLGAARSTWDDSRGSDHGAR